MTAFTIGLLVGGIVGIPIACWLEGKRQSGKEKKSGNEKLQI